MAVVLEPFTPKLRTDGINALDVAVGVVRRMIYEVSWGRSSRVHVSHRSCRDNAEAEDGVADVRVEAVPECRSAEPREVEPGPAAQ